MNVPVVSAMMELDEPLHELVKRFPRPRRIISKVSPDCPDGFFLIDPDAAATLPDNWIGPDPRPLFFVFSPSHAADAMARNLAAAYMPEGLPPAPPMPRDYPSRCRGCGVELATRWDVDEDTGDAFSYLAPCGDPECPTNDIPW